MRIKGQFHLKRSIVMLLFSPNSADRSACCDGKPASRLSFSFEPSIPWCIGFNQCCLLWRAGGRETPRAQNEEHSWLLTPLTVLFALMLPTPIGVLFTHFALLNSVSLAVTVNGYAEMKQRTTLKGQLCLQTGLLRATL